MPEFVPRYASSDRDDQNREIEENIKPDDELGKETGFPLADGHEQTQIHEEDGEFCGQHGGRVDYFCAIIPLHPLSTHIFPQTGFETQDHTHLSPTLDTLKW